MYSMKKTLTIAVALNLLMFSSFAQVGKLFASYNKLTEITGTDYVLASVESWTKVRAEDDRRLLFINTRNGEQKQIDFPQDAAIEKIEQVRLDTLNINKVLVTARTINLNNSRSIDWYDPKQVIVFTPDGKQQTQITSDDFFVNHWMINRQTGVIVVAGRKDTNKNRKLDKDDQPEILLYDLKEMKQLVKQ